MAYGTVNAEQMTTQSGYTLGAGNSSTFKNRLLNGQMVIDQRNAGSAVTINDGTPKFPVDRMYCYRDSSANNCVLTAQQSTDVPTGGGFVNSVKFTVTTPETLTGAGRFFSIQQKIEGNNVSDLLFGFSSAKTVTLSFWVKSSLTGAFGGSLMNSAYDRSYPFNYTISSANTWEQKSITIAGDQSGTWLTNTGIGLRVGWCLGTGSSYEGTANQWNGALDFAPTSSVQLINTNGATFYITGTQLEVGSTATSFDYRPYGTELQLCQRYYEATTNNSTMIFSGDVTTANDYYVYGNWVVPKRASPTFTPTIGAQSGFSSSTTSPTVSISSWSVASTSTATGARKYYFFGYTASAEL